MRKVIDLRNMAL